MMCNGKMGQTRMLLTALIGVNADDRIAVIINSDPFTAVASVTSHGQWGRRLSKGGVKRKTIKVQIMRILGPYPTFRGKIGGYQGVMKEKK